MSLAGRSISLRPKFSGSLKLGCAPIDTPFCTAQRTQSRIALAPPACQPHAMFAELTRSSSASSEPQPSPRSAFRSISMVFLYSVLQRRDGQVARAAFFVHGDRGIDLPQIRAFFQYGLARLVMR